MAAKRRLMICLLIMTMVMIMMIVMMFIMIFKPGTQKLSCSRLFWA